MINFISSQKVFNLSLKDSSYMFKVDDFGNLEHLYWGKKINGLNPNNTYPYLNRGYSSNHHQGSRNDTIEHKPLEIATYGNGDFRESSLILQMADGTYINDLKYESHRIYSDNSPNQGLPTSRNKEMSLEVTLKDAYEEVYVHLYYHTYEGLDSLSRHLEIDNRSGQELRVEKALSMSLDLPNQSYDALTLSGMWAQERNIDRFPLSRGTHSINSHRGASSHYTTPFLGVLDKSTNYHQGQVHSLNFVYSGSFEYHCEVDSIESLRIQMGIQSLNSNLSIKPNHKLMTPEVILTYSDKGINGMLQAHHNFVNDHILPATPLFKKPPILINNWEATYFDFDQDKLLEIAKSAKEVGVELFVLDDGWFGNRNDDTTSLGDWFLNKEKLPQGLKMLSDQIHNLDMKFGLWIEPEMISMKSQLYQEHPEYLLREGKRTPTPSRDQYVLDFSSSEVVRAIYEMLVKVFDELDLDYVKWDMNRPIVQSYSMITKAPIANFDYMKGFYSLIAMLQERYPKILFEACAGGGGRFDWGVLNYFPQVWTSDNTDAIERLKIQEGSVLIFPQKTMGAHVSDIPNHQTGRETPLDLRFAVAAPFNLGYELDLSKQDARSLEKVKDHNQWYKTYREETQNGRFTILESNDPKNQKAWMIESLDGKLITLYVYQVLASANAPLWRLRLNGLNINARYKIDDQIYSGSELVHFGLLIPVDMNKDFASKIITITLEEEV